MDAKSKRKSSMGGDQMISDRSIVWAVFLVAGLERVRV